jgi:enediyne biosynthesis protein E4
MIFENFRKLIIFSLIGFFAFLHACTERNGETGITLFESILTDHSLVTFENNLEFDPDFNIYNYRNFYNGGGVAVGDISGNGLPDIFFVGNKVIKQVIPEQR